MLTKTVVKLAYNIESSKTYHLFRAFLINILLNNSTRIKKYFDLFMIFLVVSTVSILIYEVKHTLPSWTIYYEYFAVSIFILEWIGRFIISFDSHRQVIKDFEESQFLNRPYKLSLSTKIIIKQKLGYVFSLMSIIDLLAILPSYRPLRILRIFLLFRLFKVLRYASSLNQFIRVFVEKKLELFLLLMLYMLVIFFSSTILYIYEGNHVNQNIESFTDAIYWAFITVSTIGYGDITPVTDAGKSITLLLIITGYTVIAFFTSIVTSTISEKLDAIKETNMIANSTKMKNFILVCGYGYAGQVLVDSLKKHKYSILVIEKNPQAVELAERNNINIIKDDATNIELLSKLVNLKTTKAVVALSNSDSVNLSIILSIRSISKTIPIIARANRFKTREKLKIAGANEIVDVNENAAFIALGYVNSPVAFEAIDEILIDEKGALLSEVEIFDNSAFINQKLSSVDFDQFHINFIGMLHRNNKKKFIFNPKKDEVTLKAKDVLIVIGYERTLKEFQTYLQSHKSKRM
jgi:voltage-gated potassium channel